METGREGTMRRVNGRGDHHTAMENSKISNQMRIFMQYFMHCFGYGVLSFYTFPNRRLTAK